eukprot:GILI01027783.1.p1 GENE.GILI01027783.1~~GILI01027783.1.p1  ORF type:complete len:296 (+),score=15.74 GILI01027783.1:23-889(+)
MQNNDLFVKGILDDWSPTENSDTIISRPERTITDERKNVVATHPAPVASKHAFQKAQPMLRFSLVFINFTFIVASMLLIMAGIVARENSAVRLCGHCADLTNVSIVFGVVLWMFALFGFNWIRQRSILFLLVYVAFLLILVLAIMAVILAAGVFDSQIRASLDSAESSDNQAFLNQWKVSISSNDTSICSLEAQYNCSGFALGCCGPGCWNETDTPAWVAEICPTYCGFPQADRQCTDSVYNTVRRNLGGFLVISCFSMLLIITGIVMAVLSRKVNQLLEPPQKENDA